MIGSGSVPCDDGRSCGSMEAILLLKKVDIDELARATAGDRITA
jgi:hypothetical protein